MNSYQAPATLGLLGLLCVASPLVFKLPAQFRTFNASTQMQTAMTLEQAYLQSKEELQRNRIQQRKETADTLEKAGVLPNGQKLKIRGYTDDPKKNPQPETTGWQEDEVVFVYDSAGVCIGQIKQRKWLWKHHYKNVCTNIPAE